MDLYCDNEEVHKDDYPQYLFECTGESREQCIRIARKAGWHINLNTFRCYCPKCKRKRKHTK